MHQLEGVDRSSFLPHPFSTPWVSPSLFSTVVNIFNVTSRWSHAWYFRLRLFDADAARSVTFRKWVTRTRATVVFPSRSSYQMSQTDEDCSFFDKERDKLAREITSVRELGIDTGTAPNLRTGLWGFALIYQCGESQNRGSIGYDEGIRNYRCTLADIPSAYARASDRPRWRWGQVGRFAWHRGAYCHNEVGWGCNSLTERLYGISRYEYPGIAKMQTVMTSII